MRELPAGWHRHYDRARRQWWALWAPAGVAYSVCVREVRSPLTPGGRRWFWRRASDAGVWSSWVEIRAVGLADACAVAERAAVRQLA